MEVLHVKNMVCDRCISTVEMILDKLSLSYSSVRLGEVDIAQELTPSEMASIEGNLFLHGFELIDRRTPVLVTKIKSALIAIFKANEVPEGFKLSKYLISKLPYDYSHMSRVFSHHEDDTIEHYLIKLRIEKAKELLSYNDLNISEVAYTLGYSSNAHFSRQFKKLVGVTPSFYRSDPTSRRSLEEI